MIRPFICTCNKRIESLEVFIASYLKNAKKHLLRPIIWYDDKHEGDLKKYHALLDKLDPIEKIPQGSYRPDIATRSIDMRSILEFPEIIYKSETYSKEFILFLEDDIVFSSQFNKAVDHIERYAIRYGVVDAVTLFAHKDKYWPEKHNPKNWFLYQIDPGWYHGNLAIMFRPELMKWWYENREDFWGGVQNGWDWKLGAYFKKHNKRIYCTHWHYVQHQVGMSAIKGWHKYEVSNRFIY